jgi:hypothetical protein
MVCNTWNYWIFGLCPPSGIINNQRTQFFGNRMFPSSGEGKILILLRPLKITGVVIEVSSKRPNRVDVSHPHLRTETDRVSETLCSLLFRIPDGGQGIKIQ